MGVESLHLLLQFAHLFRILLVSCLDIFHLLQFHLHLLLLLPDSGALLEG
jgi:hypothetical protein